MKIFTKAISGTDIVDANDKLLDFIRSKEHLPGFAILHMSHAHIHIACTIIIIYDFA